jgi:hypothetical protein
MHMPHKGSAALIATLLRHSVSEKHNIMAATITAAAAAAAAVFAVGCCAQLPDAAVVAQPALVARVNSAAAAAAEPVCAEAALSAGWLWVMRLFVMHIQPTHVKCVPIAILHSLPC